MSDDERERLEAMVRTGKRSAQVLTKARILLAADVEGPTLSDGRIVAALGTSRFSATLARSRRSFRREWPSSMARPRRS